MARMIGRKARVQGCPHGKYCPCNGPYRDRSASRSIKRREQRTWKVEAMREMRTA